MPVRNTKQKTLVLEALLLTSGRHLSAEELETLLAKRKTPVARSTIYRCLASLEASGEIRKIPMPNGQGACYQAMRNPLLCSTHYHLVCKACGKLTHFQSDGLSEALEKLPGETGLKPDMEKTLFYGTCMDCSN